ncbi:Bacterial Ig-like domain protein [anaerobic digester metagenome]
MKKITVSILTTLLMLSMVFSSSVFAANEETSAWDSFLGLFSAKTAETSDVGVEYRGHVQNKGDFPLDGSWIQGPDQLGTVGESLRLEAFWIKLTNEVPAGLHIQYRVHVQNKGWMAPVEDGALAGTQGESLQIESVEIKLVDDAGNPAVGYSVEYRGHIQNKGDMPADGSWYKDGEQLGTVGEFLRLEALEVKIVKEGSDLTAYNEAVAAANALTESDYTADSWAVLEEALANVVTADNTQEEVDAATAAINDAIDGLVKVLAIDSVTAIDANSNTVGLANATGIVSDKDKGFVITFSKEVDPTTVTKNTIKLYKGSALVAIDTPVVSSDNMTVTVYPTANLIDSTSYKLVVMSGITQANATNSLGSDKEYSFTTGTAGYVDFVQDAGGNNMNQRGGTSNVAAADAQSADQFVLKLNKAIDPATFNSSTVKLYDVSGTTRVQKAVTVLAPGATTDEFKVEISEANGLTTGNKYQLVIEGAKAVLNTNVVKEEINFTVGVTQVTPSIKQADRNTDLNSATTIWPNLAPGSLDGSSTINNGAKFYVTFNQTQDIDASTVNIDTVVLEELDEYGDVVGSVAGTVTYDSAYRAASFTPDSDLKSKTAYKLTVKNAAVTGATVGIKDVYGLNLAGTSNYTASFTTYDVQAPTVQNVTMKVGSQNPVDIVNGVTDIDNTKEIKVGFTYDEKVGTVDNDGANSNAADTDPTAGTGKIFGAGESVIIIDAATGNAVGTAPTVSRSSDKKTVYVTIPANLLSRNATYTIKLAGKSGNPTGSSTTAKAICDIGANVNRMAACYELSFSTIDNDTTAPTVEKALIGTSYATATDLATGTVNCDSSKDVYILFSELLDNTGSMIKADNVPDANIDGNVVVERKTATGTWAQVAYGNVNATVTNDNAKSKTYITIPNAIIANDYAYRVKIYPSETGSVQDLAANKLAATYTFEFTTNGTLAFTKVATGTAMAANRGATNADINAGDGSGVGEISIGSGITGSSANDILGVELADGTFFFTQQAAPAGPAAPTQLTEDLPSMSVSGATVVDLTTASASFSNLESGISVSDPIAVRIDASANATVDTNSIDNTTVKLIKVSDGTEISTEISSRLIGNKAYVSINPTDSLEYNTQYKVVVQNVKDTLSNTIATAVETSFTTRTASVAKLAIDSVTPADGTTGVAVNSTFTINFNETPSATLTAVTAAPNGAGEIALYDETNAAYVDFTIATSNSGKTATLTPKSFLAPGTTYSVIVDEATASSAGTTFTADQQFSFATETNASVEPTIASALYFDADNNGVDAGDTVIINFNTAIDSTTVTTGACDANLKFALDLGGVFNDATNDSNVAVSGDKKTVTITLGTNPVLIPNATKVNVVSGTIKTLNGVNVNTSAVTITK